MGNPKAIPLSRANRVGGAFAGLILALGGASWALEAARAGDLANVDDARISENAKTGKEWPSNGFDYAVSRFSPLDQITTANVGKLGLAWSYALDSIRGVEATPIVVDGAMYITAPWSIVHAINAKTGEKIWAFDSKSPRDQGYKLCCDVVVVASRPIKARSMSGRPTRA
jgi:glucose dehydrogenase